MPKQCGSGCASTPSRLMPWSQMLLHNTWFHLLSLLSCCILPLLASWLLSSPGWHICCITICWSFCGKRTRYDYLLLDPLWPAYANRHVMAMLPGRSVCLVSSSCLTGPVNGCLWAKCCHRNARPPSTSTTTGPASSGGQARPIQHVDRDEDMYLCSPANTSKGGQEQLGTCSVGSKIETERDRERPRDRET